MSRTVSETLGAFVAEAGADSMPDRVRHAGKRALVNAFGTALQAASSQAVEGAVRAMQAFSPGQEASLIGRTERLDAPGAAFVNAIGINMLDFDDTHLPTIIHPTAPVAPAVFALAERLHLSGADALSAFLVGAEVTCRIGDMVSPGHYARGWHITSTCGVFGAAAASARLLGLDGGGIAHAIAIASSLACGTVENLTTGAKNASVGSAARNGILAALLAREGYEGAPAAIEGQLGWARAGGDEPNVAGGLKDLGTTWAFALNAYKPYPAGIVFHSVIDACFEIRATQGVAAAEIARVIVKGDALLLARGSREVRTERDARVSLHHAAASVFRYDAAGISEFAHEKVMNPETIAFRALVQGVLDPSLPPGAATVEVTTHDGRHLSATVIHPRGSIERPLSDGELEAKTYSLAGDQAKDRTASLITALWRLDTIVNVGDIMEKARGA